MLKLNIGEDFRALAIKIHSSIVELDYDHTVLVPQDVQPLQRRRPQPVLLDLRSHCQEAGEEPLLWLLEGKVLYSGLPGGGLGCPQGLVHGHDGKEGGKGADGEEGAD